MRAHGGRTSRSLHSQLRVAFVSSSTHFHTLERCVLWLANAARSFAQGLYARRWTQILQQKTSDFLTVSLSELFLCDSVSSTAKCEGAKWPSRWRTLGRDAIAVEVVDGAAYARFLVDWFSVLAWLGRRHRVQGIGCAGQPLKLHGCASKVVSAVATIVGRPTLDHVEAVRTSKQMAELSGDWCQSELRSDAWPDDWMASCPSD